MSKELRVVSVQVKDVLGAREFAMAPGKITVVRGRNGSGKTTALQAVQAALGGGNLRRLARVDPEGKDTEPEVVLVIEGPGSEAYRVERKGEKLRIRQRVGDTAAFEDVGKPQGWLSSLFDPDGANPVAFLTAKDADRARMLLEALPLTFDRAALLREMGIGESELPPIPRGLHPLEEVELIREAVFRTRTGVNRDLDGKKKAADQVRRNTPAVIPDDPRAAIETLQARVVDLTAELARATLAATEAERRTLGEALATHDLEAEKVKAAFTDAARSKRAAHEARAAELRAALERQIADEKAAVEAEIDQLRTADEARLDELDARLGAARKAAEEVREAAEADLAALRNTLAANREQLATLRAQAETAAQARALVEQADQFDREAAELQAESDRLTAALEANEAYARRMAKDLPIDGLSIEGKTIRVHGVPYEQLNTQQKVDIAVDVAVLRAKGARLPVVFVDGAEALDSEHFGLLVERLKRSGVQAFVGRVEDTELQVVADEAVAAAR